MNIQQLKWFFLVLLSFIWGSSFILIKKGLVGLNPLQLGSARIIFTAFFLLMIGFKSLKQINKQQWKSIVITSFFGTFAPVYLFSIAETQISSSICSILNSLTPLFTLLLGALIFKIGYQKKQFFGVLIGLVGSLLLVFNGAVNHPNENYWFTFLVVLASIGYAININLIKKHLANLNPLSITTGNFAVLLVPALIILFTTPIIHQIQQPVTKHSLFFILILGIIGTGIANIIFFKLIQIASPIFASSVTYMIPIVACIWGLFDNETLTTIQIVGAFIILIGVFLSSKIVQSK